MSNITNNYAEGSCVFEAGSTQNGDVIVNVEGNILQNMGMNIPGQGGSSSQGGGNSGDSSEGDV